MNDVPPQPDAPEPKTPDPVAEDLPDYVIEGARSSRSRCKTCRRKIDKGVLRIGILIEGPYGTGYLWHHLNCAAKRRLGDVEAAYEAEAWKEAKEPPARLPDIEKLRGMQQQAEEKKAQRKEIPYAELDPSGRARCKSCGEPMEKGSLRVTLGREVAFGNQIRTTPINVHTRCVARTLEEDDCNTEVEGFEQNLRAHSSGLEAQQIDQALAEIGDLNGP